MTDIAELKGIGPDEAERLRDNGIATLDDLWARVGEDFNEGIVQVANNAKIEPQRLIDLLADQGVREARQGDDSWLKRHWFDVVLIMGLVFLVGSVLRVLIAFEWLPPRLWSRDPVVVSAATELPAFHIIGPNDVMVRTPAEPEAVAALEDVVGRYPLQAIPVGTVLRADQLSTVRLPLADMADRQLLTVPVGAGALSQMVMPGDHVSLLFSPRDPSETESPPPIDVIVWAVDRRDDAPSSIVVAMTPKDLAAVKPLLVLCYS
jgi:hypothetical protein